MRILHDTNTVSRNSGNSDSKFPEFREQNLLF